MLGTSLLGSLSILHLSFDGGAYQISVPHPHIDDVTLSITKLSLQKHTTVGSVGGGEEQFPPTEALQVRHRVPALETCQI